MTTTAAAVAHEEPEPVPCLVCKRPLRTPATRARRVGEHCWRRQRAERRAQAVAAVLPGLTRRSPQSGPDLFTTRTSGEVRDVDQDQDPDQQGHSASLRA